MIYDLFKIEFQVISNACLVSIQTEVIIWIELVAVKAMKFFFQASNYIGS